jgi:chemotaxis protein methyltransferase CheR
VTSGSTPAAAGAAHGSIEDAELELLLEGIYKLFGYDFRQYARSTVKRRLAEILAKTGLNNLSELQGRVLRDTQVLNSVVSALSIQVSSFFRDAGFYLALRRRVVPILKTYPSIRIWHAGCATGEEVYSTAILLGEEGLLNRCRFYATDINAGALETARRGIYSSAEMRGSGHRYTHAGGSRDLSDYIETAGHEGHVRPDLMKRITFFQHNLVTDSSFNDFHLILCRNVLIYFSKPLQARVHNLLYDSLVRLGILGLGASETLHLTPREKHYRPLDEAARIYRRID